MELRELLKLDILGAIDTLGTGEVIQALSESVRSVGTRRLDDWDHNLQRLADSLEVLARHTKEFEEHYGSREP